MRLGHRREGGPPVEVRAVLLDVDGMLTVSWKPLPGAVEAVRALRDAGLRLALLTNTTSRTPSIAGHFADRSTPVTTSRPTSSAGRRPG